MKKNNCGVIGSSTFDLAFYPLVKNAKISTNEYENRAWIINRT
jgi:hypothetical protein